VISAVFETWQDQPRCGCGRTESVPGGRTRLCYNVWNIGVTKCCICWVTLQITQGHWKSKCPQWLRKCPQAASPATRHSPHPSHRYGPFLHNVARSVVCTFGTGWAVWKCLNQSKCSFGAESCELFKTSLFCKSFPPQPSLSSPGLTPRIPRTVCRYFWAYPFVLFCFFSFFHL